MTNVITIREYGVISEGIINQPYNSKSKEIDSKSFNSLINFIEENSFNEDFEKAFQIFRKKNRRHIRVKNYVGTIETKQNTVLEIIPKIEINTGDELSEEESKKILLRMLKSLHNSPYLNLGSAALAVKDNLPIFEVFIKNFTQELSILLSKGLRSDYIANEENLNFLKGKLLIKENIKFNSILRSKFFCQFSDYNLNIPPNKLIKSCLLRFRLISNLNSNKKIITKLLMTMEKIQESVNIQADLTYCSANKKLLNSYGNLINWCEVFLTNKSFFNFHGKNINQAILFPMEKLFESYVANLLKRHCKSLTISAQDKKYNLLSQKKYASDIDFSLKKFRLKPDIVINHDQIIIDTKWKIISENQQNFDIKEADVYQMHAYGKRYQEGNVDNQPPRLCLLYPKSLKFDRKLMKMRYGDDLYLDVIPFDLTNNQEIEVRNLIANLTAD